MKNKKIIIIGSIVGVIALNIVANNASAGDMYPKEIVCTNENALDNCISQEELDHAIKITEFSKRLEAEGGYEPNYSESELMHDPTPIELEFNEKHPHASQEELEKFWMSRVVNCDSLDNYEDWKECWWRPWLYGF